MSERIDDKKECNVANLIAWLQKLPPDFQSAEIGSCVGPQSSSAKRVVAYRFKDGSGRGICVNSMGSHMSDDWWDSVEIIGVLQE
jgi:hypothetical protein